jgi:hypothetical protein
MVETKTNAPQAAQILPNIFLRICKDDLFDGYNFQSIGSMPFFMR